MRIENIANQANDRYYELTIIGTEAEIEAYHAFTKHTTDFIEEELNEEYSITVISSHFDTSKKEFRAEITADLKAFRNQK